MMSFKYSQVKQAAKQFIIISYTKLIIQGDLLTHYSVELSFIYVAIDTFSHPSSLGGGWSGLWPGAWVVLEILELFIIDLYTDVCKMCFDSKVVDDPRRLSNIDFL